MLISIGNERIVAEEMSLIICWCHVHHIHVAMGKLDVISDENKKRRTETPVPQMKSKIGTRCFPTRFSNT